MNVYAIVLVVLGALKEIYDGVMIQKQSNLNPYKINIRYLLVPGMLQGVISPIEKLEILTHLELQRTTLIETRNTSSNLTIRTHDFLYSCKQLLTHSKFSKQMQTKENFPLTYFIGLAMKFKHNILKIT